jgi:hypothetical protein
MWCKTFNYRQKTLKNIFNKNWEYFVFQFKNDRGWVGVFDQRQLWLIDWWPLLSSSKKKKKIKNKKKKLKIQFSILEIGEGESVRESVFSKMKMILKVQVSEVVKFGWTTLIKVSSSCHLSSSSSKKSF